MAPNLEPARQGETKFRIVQSDTESEALEALNDFRAFLILKRCSPKGHFKLISALRLSDRSVRPYAF